MCHKDQNLMRRTILPLLLKGAGILSFSLISSVQLALLRALYRCWEITDEKTLQLHYFRMHASNLQLWLHF